MKNLKKFSPEQIDVVNNSVAMAEELVSNHYKMSASQWLRPQYDVKTLADLGPEEIVDGPFAQIVRYKGQRKDSSLGSTRYDFYKICLQDHIILKTLDLTGDLRLFPFSLYIVIHELIHIVRFSKFIQNFDAIPDERMAEEARVHHHTQTVVSPVRVHGLNAVLKFYEKWHQPFENLRTP
jgi:hypothetical protein